MDTIKDLLPIAPEILAAVIKAAVLATLLWQGVRSVEDKVAWNLPSWAGALLPRLLALGIYVLIVYVPQNDVILGGMAALFAAPLVYDMVRGAQAKANGG